MAHRLLLSVQLREIPCSAHFFPESDESPRSAFLLDLSSPLDAQAQPLGLNSTRPNPTASSSARNVEKVDNAPPHHPDSQPPRHNPILAVQTHYSPGGHHPVLSPGQIHFDPEHNRRGKQNEDQRG